MHKPGCVCDYSCQNSSHSFNVVFTVLALCLKSVSVFVNVPEQVLNAPNSPVLFDKLFEQIDFLTDSFIHNRTFLIDLSTGSRLHNRRF